MLCMMTKSWFNCLPNNKILDVNKLEAFADNKLNVTEMMISLYNSVENTVGNEENACYQHFLLFPQHFPKPSSITHSHSMTPFDAPGKKAF